MFGAVRDGLEVGDAQKKRADLTVLQTRTDQRLDQIAMFMHLQTQGLRESEMAKQIEMQNSRHDELMTGMRTTTIQRLDQVASQMQDMMIYMERVSRCTETSPRKETREQPQVRDERAESNHDIYGPRGVVVDACIGRTQVEETLLDTGD